MEFLYFKENMEGIEFISGKKKPACWDKAGQMSDTSWVNWCK